MCRSLGFGSYPHDSPRLNTAALVGVDKVHGIHCGHVAFALPAPIIGLGLPWRYTLWVVFQNVRRNIGFSLVLLDACASVILSETLYATSFDRQLISGPIARSFVECFSAFAHATCSLSVSRSV